MFMTRTLYATGLDQINTGILIFLNLDRRQLFTSIELDFVEVVHRPR